MPALGAAAVDHQPAILGGHAGAVAMGALTTGGAWIAKTFFHWGPLSGKVWKSGQFVRIEQVTRNTRSGELRYCRAQTTPWCRAGPKSVAPRGCLVTPFLVGRRRRRGDSAQLGRSSVVVPQRPPRTCWRATLGGAIQHFIEYQSTSRARSRSGSGRLAGNAAATREAQSQPMVTNYSVDVSSYARGAAAPCGCQQDQRRWGTQITPRGWRVV